MLNYCKDCVKTRVHDYRIKNIERVREYDRKRGALQHRREYGAEYRRQNREQHVKTSIRWAARNPEKRKAHVAVQRALKAGKLERKVCEVCAAQKVEAHHADYTQPLQVVWLCSKHHAELHKHERNKQRKHNDNTLRVKRTA